MLSVKVAITSQYAAIIRMLSDPGLKSTIIAHCANLASRLTVRVLTMIDITFLVVWKSSEIGSVWPKEKERKKTSPKTHAIVNCY